MGEFFSSKEGGALFKKLDDFLSHISGNQNRKKITNLKI
jgi:hypothetical protein